MSLSARPCKALQGHLKIFKGLLYRASFWWAWAWPGQAQVVSRIGAAAFALLKSDGSVVCWGDGLSGGQLSGREDTDISFA